MFIFLPEEQYWKMDFSWIYFQSLRHAAVILDLYIHLLHKYLLNSYYVLLKMKEEMARDLYIASLELLNVF